jgi:hypothetical protein
MATRLTDTQLTILAEAAKRDDGAVLPLPAAITLEGKRLGRTLQALIRRGLVTAVASKLECIGGEDQEAPEDLRITRAGLLAIGVEPEDAETSEEAEPDKAGEVVVQPETPDAPKTKAGTVEAMLRRSDGATITALQDATGWQPHSVRAVLSGLRKKGRAVERTKSESGETVYRIAGV